jgi:hypothetical protein
MYSSTLQTINNLKDDTTISSTHESTSQTSTTMSSPPPSTRMKTVQAVLHGYSTLNPSDILPSLSPTFTHHILPASLAMPSRDLAAFNVHFSRISSIFRTFEMVPQRIFEDPSQNTVVMYCKMVGELTRLGPWENECCMIVRMSENEEMVEEITEFVDSNKARLLHEKLSGLGKGNVMREGMGTRMFLPKGFRWDHFLTLMYVVLLAVFLYGKV